MMTRGLRNNNPLNIRWSNDVFMGEMKGVDKCFKSFLSLPYGYRAGFVILASYLARGQNSIEKIIARWAPPTENNTENYIVMVEKWSGVPRNRVLSATDGADYISIVSAMSFVENGRNADILAINEGFNLQSKIKCL